MEKYRYKPLKNMLLVLGTIVTLPFDIALTRGGLGIITREKIRKQFLNKHITKNY